jgi:hypothetical protein
MAKKKAKKSKSGEKKEINGTEVILMGKDPRQKASAVAISRWDDRFYLQVFELVKKGLTEKSIADHLKVTVATFRKWRKERPALQEAIKNGKEQSTFGKWEHLKKDQRSFLVAYSRTGNVSDACRAAGIDRKRHYRWLRDDKNPTFENSYTSAFAEAEEEATDMLVSEARRRAYSGLQRMKFHQGLPIMVPCMPNDEGAVEAVDGKGDTCWIKPYTEHEYSDTLLIFLLKAKRPEEFRDRPIQLEQTTTINLQEMVEEVENQSSIVLDAQAIKRIAESHAND